MAVPETLIHKYEEERAKRLNPEKGAQYIQFDESKSPGLSSDIYVDHDSLAAKGYPLQDRSEVKVLITGAGMHGLMLAHRLIVEAGIKSNEIVLVDKAGGFGGTWYWNRYPGIMCDIETYCYLPLLEETGYKPRHRYSDGYEIREQCERIAAMWNIQGQFCTTVTYQRWDESSKRWIVNMTHEIGPGHEPRYLTVSAQFLIIAPGHLTIPRVPKLNGIDVFRATSGKQLMHTARWDWFVSGGSQDHPELVNFKGKKVGVIGTAATATQVIPHIAKWATQTYVFQRTPSYIGPQLGRDISPDDWAKVAYTKGWQYERIENLDAISRDSQMSKT